MTMLKSFTVFLVFLLSFAAYGATGFSGMDDINEAVSLFVSKEFAGVTDMRVNYAIFTSNSREERVSREIEEKHGGIDGTYDADIDYYQSTLFGVTKYRISNIRTENDNGTATIMYDRVLSTIGTDSERQLVHDHLDCDIVKLNLIKKNNRWFVVDPPTIRISIYFLFDMYHSKLATRLRYGKEDPLALNNSIYHPIKRWLPFLKEVISKEWTQHEKELCSQQ